MFDQSLKTEVGTKQDADYIFYELTRSICPDCRRVIDAQILLREDKVFRVHLPNCEHKCSYHPANGRVVKSSWSII